MQVYLVARQGGRTAFCVTTSYVTTDLDFLIEEILEDLVQRKYYNHYTLKEGLSHRPYTKNLYYTELNDTSKFSKKVSDKMWKEIVKDYIKRHPGKIKDAEEKRKK